MATRQADLARIRDQVGRALEDFLGRQHAALGDIGPDMLPWLSAITELLAGGKRLRPAVCYWGWRAAGGEDCPEILAAPAALALLHGRAPGPRRLLAPSDPPPGRPPLPPPPPARPR